MDAHDAFKVGFLARCVEDGLSPEQTLGAIKTAQDKLAGILETLAGIVKPVIGAGWNVGVPLALAAPPILGGLAGYGAARLGDIDETDVKAIQEKELLDTYKTETERLRRQKAMRDYRKALALQRKGR